jgi:hypothetical protein
VLRVDLLEKARNSKQNILLDQSLSWLIMIDHHNDELWWNGSSRWTSMDQWIGEIQAIPWDFLYIFYICPIYIYICVLYFRGKKPWIPVKSFPSTNPSAQCYQPSGVGRRQRRAEGEGKSGSSSVYGRSVFFFLRVPWDGSL